MLQRQTHVGSLWSHVRVAKPAIVIGEHTMAATAQRRQVAGPLVAEVFVSPVVDLERVLASIVIAEPAPKTRCLQFSQPYRVLTPLATRDVLVVVH